MSQTGLLTLEQLRAQAANHDIETVLVVFTDLYGRFLGKRLTVDYFLQETVNSGMGACNYLFAVDMEMQAVPGYDFAAWEQGFGDMHVVPDMQTLRVATWLDKTAIVIGDALFEDNHQPVSIAPRQMLRHQINRLECMGLSAKTASELEYYLINQSYREVHQQGYQNLEAAGWYMEDYHVLQGFREEPFNAALRRELQRSAIPVEGTKGECGHGQHELNLAYSNVLEMADRHVLTKQCAKEIAEDQGVSVTFMPKFVASQAGSSCHMHLSLWRDGKNAFLDNDTFRWFLGGWIKHTPEIMPLLAPTVNAYKRYQADSWAPVNLVWSRENRTAGFRIVGHDQSLRIECRIPGADVNPYLAYAAVIAAGIEGIQQRIEPPAEFKGNAYAISDVPKVPGSLAAAVERFEQSEFTREQLGQEVVQHYAHFYRAELQAYESAVTDWERQRYFEQI